MPNTPTPPSFALRLFGPFEAAVNGETLRPPRAQAGAWILALLALHQKRPVERAWLASLLWPSSSHEQALYNLRRNLTDVRQILGEMADRLTSPTPRTLSLDLKGAGCDVLEFDALLQRVDSAALQGAVALYRGPLLEGCKAEWALPERRSREQAYLTALETLAARAMQAGDHQEAISRLSQVLLVDTYRETALCSLLQTLTASGDSVAATLAYREFRLRLHKELQTAPSPETQALYRSLRHRVKNISSPTAALRSSGNQPAPPLSLPQPLSNFVGRQDERVQVLSCLDRARLVTLTGAGGVGKTRLAVAAAEEMAGNYQEGIWFVDLAPLSEAALVPVAIASGLGLAEKPGRPPVETLLQHLAAKELLLILDNCEHLLEACVSLVQSLLKACPALQILATSRQALGLSGEIVWRVPSLAFPAEAESTTERFTAKREEKEALSARLQRFDALRLFVERACESYPAFALHPRNIATVARICRRLDGIPLAIELAAARMRSLPLEEIDARLQTNFRLLRGGLGTPARQETLEAVFTWSWALLAPSERLLLKRLSVFAGGWTLAAAEAICAEEGLEQAEIIGLLLSLVDKSLVVYAPPKEKETEEKETEEKEGNTDSQESEARYYLLETTCRFVSERLSESGASGRIRDRHRDHFLAWAEEVSPKLWKAEQGWWFERLEAEHHNLRGALEWCRKQDAIEAEFRFVLALSRFWNTHGHLSEGAIQLETALARVTPELPPELHASALLNAGWMAHARGDNTASRLYYEQSLAICQRIGYEFPLPTLLNFLACAYSDEGDFTRARALFEEANRLCLRLNTPGPRAAVLNNLGESLLRQGKIVDAQAFLEEAAALCRETGANQMLGITRGNLAVAALKQGHYEEALAHNASTLRMYQAARALVNMPEALDLMAVLACRLKQWQRSACLLGVAEGLHRTLGVPMESTLVPELVEASTATQRALGSEGFTVRFTEGLSMTMEEAISYALATEKFSL